MGCVSLTVLVVGVVVPLHSNVTGTEHILELKTPVVYSILQNSKEIS